MRMMASSEVSSQPLVLLDANVLLALAWPHHTHHPAAQAWFKQNAAGGWATCALTQGALVRVSLQRSFVGDALGGRLPSAAVAFELISGLLEHGAHRFLDLDFGFDRVIATCTGGIVGHRQITDAYLLTLAVHQNAKLLSFDRRIGALLATPAERKQHLWLL